MTPVAKVFLLGFCYDWAMDYKTILGVTAVIVGFIGYVPYFRNIFKNKTKPHAFSWLVWGILTAIAFVGQVVGKGGAGTWVTGFTALICFSIFALSLIKGRRDFPLVDWLCLAGAGLTLVLWALTKNPLTAIILVTFIDMLGFFPTFRKAYLEPNSETAFTYTLSGLKFLISIFALGTLSTLTILYPASLIITNLGFVAMLAVRRKHSRAKVIRGS
jgi:hypothetical protein